MAEDSAGDDIEEESRSAQDAVAPSDWFDACAGLHKNKLPASESKLFELAFHPGSKSG